MQPGHVSAMATSLPHSGTRRLLRCHPGAMPFSATRETVFCALRPSEDKVLRALKMLLAQGDLAGSGLGLGVTEATVLAWLTRAAPQAEARNDPRLQPLPVTQGHRDEMGHFIARQHARATDEAGASLPAGQDGRPWSWVSCAPECRWRIAAGVGPRTRETAKEGVAAPQARGAGIPACFRDGGPGYLAALSAACHIVMTCAPTGKRGRPRQPVCALHPALISGQVVKHKTHGTRRTRSTRVVRGAERLTHLGLTLRTAWVERGTLTWRQAVAPGGRQTSSFCKDRERLRPRVVVLQAFSNVARPPRSLRRQWPRHERTRHGAICPRWRECPPAMAAGLTDHVWTLRELLTAQFEPLEFQSISQ
jgi:hypothetical protein